MEPWKNVSIFRRLFSPVTDLPIGDECFTNMACRVSEVNLDNMTELSTALDEFQQRFENDPFGEAVRNLQAFVRYFQGFSLPPSYQQQLEIMNRMKSWMPRMPSGVIGFAARDPRFLLILAYYHTTIIAAEPHVPTAIRALFLLKRTEIVGRIT